MGLSTSRHVIAVSFPGGEFVIDCHQRNGRDHGEQITSSATDTERAKLEAVTPRPVRSGHDPCPDRDRTYPRPTDLPLRGVTVPETEEEDAMAKHDRTNQNDSTPAVRSSEWSDMAERWLGEWPRPRLWSELRRGLDDRRDVMNVEEFTDGDHLVVRAEMPGIDPDKDVRITVSDHTLHLQAERRQETKTEEHGTYRSEFSYGRFARTVALPIGASDKDVKATYKDGILEVRIPVDRNEADAERVPVQRV